MNKDTHLIYETYMLKGVAFGMDLDAIAKKHGVELSSLKNEFEKGMKTEMEHTKDEATAEKIAKDHLFEDPCYYTKLAKMESENQEARAYAPSESNEELDVSKYKDIVDQLSRGVFNTESEIERVDQGVREGIFDVEVVEGKRQVVLTNDAVKKIEIAYPELKGKFWECGKCKADYPGCGEAKREQSEEAEMPSKDFNKLKQHINKGPITIKKPSKEVPYTHRYMHDLVKQDSREDQREENTENITPVAVNGNVEDLGNGYSIYFDEIREPDNRYYSIDVYRNAGNHKYIPVTSFYPSGNDGDKMRSYVGAENPKSKQLVIDLLNKYELNLPNITK